jgi:hypothetical protein
MEITKKQKEMLRWYAAGHSAQMVAQYVDMDTREVMAELQKLDVEDRWQAEALLSGSQEENVLKSPENGNLSNAGEEVPPFKQDMPNREKLAEYDKRKIAERGGNTIDLIPLAKQQAFKMDISWRSLDEIKAKWTTIAGGEEKLEAAVKEFNLKAYKHLYPKKSEGEEDAS